MIRTDAGTVFLYLRAMVGERGGRGVILPTGGPKTKKKSVLVCQSLFLM